MLKAESFLGGNLSISVSSGSLATRYLARQTTLTRFSDEKPLERRVERVVKSFRTSFLPLSYSSF